MRGAILDLPLPMEPVMVDLDRPLEEQLSGPYLEAARKMLANPKSLIGTANPDGD